MKMRKACPVIIRSTENNQELLSFRHPLAGKQVVKGTIEANEAPEQAVLRELAEESGITTATIISKLGVWQSHLDSHEWHFFLCDPQKTLEEEWSLMPLN